MAFKLIVLGATFFWPDLAFRYISRKTSSARSGAFAALLCAHADIRAV
eukprot:CAMPEP_0168205616 /NCGR_PEP_ID=MMETSP0140_2-20121125/471_1 /TAXON_ID=44445 /ORGANISM="Pseudo-nitzschia australis, Strain 10249 10 AB" /LENGTH=47 /DNA_ID= /DNA_START= /DNA_END= /DNA_ORIENTATION=